MSTILNIDTATDIASVSIAKQGAILAEMSNGVQKNHGSFLQPAIHDLLKKTGILFKEIDGIAISAGPGSYTGLRVGMASAKGLSFALNKPLLAIGTLEILAYATILQVRASSQEHEILICPMIDARRMEVFTAVYDKDMNVVMEPSALILSPDSFANWLLKNKVFFAGSGVSKWKRICTHSNAEFIELESNALAMSILSYDKYSNNTFADVAYSQPIYLKEFHGGNI
jgi:tRNA threonylcarbamoyladenosine biosynthesis protein TsaB